jgi:hypothetical protein
MFQIKLLPIHIDSIFKLINDRIPANAPITMPYTPGSSNLPENVKKMPIDKRTQWCAVWNDSYKRCQEKGGRKCEGVAFRNANGVMKS